MRLKMRCSLLIALVYNFFSWYNFSLVDDSILEQINFEKLHLLCGAGLPRR